MKYGITHIIVCVIFLISGQALGQASGNKLVSGQSIPNGSAPGAGFFCMPSYQAGIMGLADANDDGVSDLWIQSTNHSARGVFLYLFKTYADDGTPVFAEPIKIKAPFDDKGKNQGTIFQDADGSIYGIWRFGATLQWSVFDRSQQAFQPFSNRTITGLPARISDWNLLNNGGSTFFVFGVRDKGVFGPNTPWPRVVSYSPEGFWPYPIVQVGLSGYHAESWKDAKIEATPLTDLDQTSYTLRSLSMMQQKKQSFVLAGSRLGNMIVYPLQGNFSLGEKKYIADVEGNLMRHPSVQNSVCYFEGTDGRSGIIAQGEGGIFFYKDRFETSKNGNLVFESPVPLLQENPDLFGGSLVIPNLVDWDGDGMLDIISGSSAGYIEFFKNAGTNETPRFQNPVRLTASGQEIHIQAGYRGSIQGPQEARWGYTSPNVTDWNGDGLPDIVLGDIRGVFTVYLNAGTKTTPELKAPKPIYHMGLDMFGSWRVRPGIGTLGGKMAFINQDSEDELHLYWQIDDYNVLDGGKLRLEDGSPIKGARLPAGAVGRTKIEIVDWDGDGIKDLVLGTYGKQSIPEPKNGYPFHFPKRGSTPLFLKNVGTEENPIFAYPKPIMFKGKHILHGGHECGVAVGHLGSGNTLNMIVGEENGRFVFYERKDLSW
ncbi:VCBS repeat-containing protein [Sphingobacterium sp. SGG-5]|uniref:FG-GAP repeat domain-containing protein n=1 Tax=Sphingobacterium sp. SGG-5 TaxID=2710881 RepID=UPI0013EC4B23|nr:VCBS repeat-containing protein [Sphingobacterium sp. SGG-5]NGM61347.1 VCBS repeat-containing protein [Sphingobacterium sp. SGG-5]